MLQLLWSWVKTNQACSRHLTAELVCLAIHPSAPAMLFYFLSECFVKVKSFLLTIWQVTSFRFVLCSQGIVVPRLQESQGFISRQDDSASLGGSFFHGGARGHLLTSCCSKCFDFPSPGSHLYIFCAHWTGLRAFWSPVCAPGNAVIVSSERQDWATRAIMKHFCCSLKGVGLANWKNSAAGFLITLWAINPKDKGSFFFNQINQNLQWFIHGGWLEDFELFFFLGGGGFFAGLVCVFLTWCPGKGVCWGQHIWANRIFKTMVLSTRASFDLYSFV